jgi:tetratricopeptide (TPR) repeat protein
MTIEPVYTPSELDEIGGLNYLLVRLQEYLERGLIAPESFQTVVAESEARRRAIERAGGFSAALAQARTLAKSQPRQALAWVERARDIDPARVEAWELLVALHWALDQDDDAILRCEQAAQQFPALEAQLDRLRGERQGRADARRRSLEQARRQDDVNQWLAQARHALENRRDLEAIGLCRQVLLVHPGQTDALALAAYAHQRLDQLDQALEMYEALQRAQPQNNTWPLWVRKVRMRRSERVANPTAEPVAAPGPSAAAPHGDAPFVSPNVSWSSFTGEFLLEHWQKLILCLAVLLIVVSSTVGAHLLLGDLLWSPVGKCALALVATLLFAVLGAGLVHWGAGRAGRMMLIATLIVVPIHFMLAGEMRLLLEPPSPRHLFLAVDALALIALVRWTSGMLARRSGARFLTIALLLLSIGSAATTRGSPIAWSLQFASFQLSPLVFLASVWILGRRRWGSSSREHLDFVYMMLGLLGFALVSCLFRTGYYALRLETSLYALPLMVGAIACVHTARRLVPYEPNGERLALMRLGGYALSGLAFALVLAGNAAPRALYSGNSLAVALLGLILYAASLRDDRHPAFLYMAVAAIVAGRWGAHYFLADRLHAIEETVRQLLGYPDHLPTPFRAILGLIPSTALGCLAIWFARNWHDRRLARHCHYIGVPLSIAACVWSGFEPLAAVICLSA